VLGVARALVEEPEDTLPPVDRLEDELMELIRPYLADDDQRPRTRVREEDGAASRPTRGVL